MTDPQFSYTHIIQVLGKDSTDTSFRDLTENEQPKVTGNTHVTYYSFDNAGFRLVYSNRRQYFFVAEFHVNTPAVQDGKLKAYPNDFLAGISAGDSMFDIERKMHSSPKEQLCLPNEAVIRYEIEDLTVSFFFDGPGTRMKGAMIKLKRATKAVCET